MVSPADEISEQELENAICELLDTFGIYYHHDRPARTGRVAGGKAVWRNHFRGPKGFPDLMIVGSKVIFAELKSQRGRLSPEQTEWLRRLKKAGADTYVWRPSEWLNGSIIEILGGLK